MVLRRPAARLQDQVEDHRIQGEAVHQSRDVRRSQGVRLDLLGHRDRPLQRSRREWCA